MVRERPNIKLLFSALYQPVIIIDSDDCLIVVVADDMEETSIHIDTIYVVIVSKYQECIIVCEIKNNALL